MSYPTAYRTAAAREVRSIRGQPGAQQRPRHSELPRPANDNVKPIPPPANDNHPQPPKVPPGRARTKAAARFALRRVAPRMIPYLGWALTGLELWDMYRRWGEMQNEHPYPFRLGGLPVYPGWNLVFDCAAEGPPNTPMMAGSVALACNTFTRLISVYEANVANRATDFGTFWQSHLGSDLAPVGVPQTHWRYDMKYVYRYPKSGGQPAIAPPLWSPTTPGWWHNIPKYPYKALPILDPMAMPVNQPAPAVRPAPARPVRPLNPHRNPVEQPQTGPQPAPRPRPGALPGPGTSTTVTPGQPIPASRPASPARPPGKGEKEKKLKTGLPPGIIARAVNQATESKDVIDAIYAALPKKLRGKLYWQGKATTPQERALAIWQHFDQINWQEALANLVKNQLEDAFIGRVGRLGARANAARGRFAPDGQSGIGVGTGFF